MRTRYILIDCRTKQRIFTVPCDFGWMTEAAIYALAHDLAHAEVEPISVENICINLIGHGLEYSHVE